MDKRVLAIVDLESDSGWAPSYAIQLASRTQANVVLVAVASSGLSSVCSNYNEALSGYQR
jgi:hypothetical protein